MQTWPTLTSAEGGEELGADGGVSVFHASCENSRGGRRQPTPLGGRDVGVPGFRERLGIYLFFLQELCSFSGSVSFQNRVDQSTAFHTRSLLRFSGESRGALNEEGGHLAFLKKLP